MGLLDKIKGLFSRQAMPDETRLLLSGVADIQELRHGLDEIVTKNEVELKEVEREIDKLEKIELSEKDKVKAGSLTEREKLNTLRYVKRLRTRMDSYQKRHKIHQENIDLHLGLLDRIDEMEAMELKAVKQEQIDEIAVDYAERVEKHKEIIRAGKIAAGQDERSLEDSGERRELEELEKEILGEGGDGKEVEKTPGGEEPVEDEPDELDELDEPVATPVPKPPEKTRPPLTVGATEPDEDLEDEPPVSTERKLELE